MKKFIIYATGNMYFDRFEPKEVLTNHTIWDDNFSLETLTTNQLREYFPDFLSGVKDYKVVQLQTIVTDTNNFDPYDPDNFISVTVSKVIKNWEFEPPDIFPFDDEDYLD